MKKLYATIALAMMAMTSFAQEANDTTYVMMNFTQNPWNYPVREITSGWKPDYKDWDAPGAILNDTDFSWPIAEGSSAKVKVTLYAVDTEESEQVAVYGNVEINAAEASSYGITDQKVNILYTVSGTRLRFEAPEGYKFGKMVFYTYRNANFLVGDEYDEEYEYEYNGSTFKQKLKVWKPTAPKKNQYDFAIWEGDEKNILFNYPYFSAHFVKIDIRLVPDGSAGIKEMENGKLEMDNEVYDLQGRQVKNPQRGSIYIVNGRKMTMK